jgi:hypothetical protein
LADSDYAAQADAFDAWSPWLATPPTPGLPPPGPLLPPATPQPMRPPGLSPGAAAEHPAPLVDLRNSSPLAPPGALPPAAPAAVSGALGVVPATGPVPAENGHTLGLALLLVGIGSAVGVKYGGLFGGAAGAMYGGSAVNAIRAARCVIQGTPQADKEAAVSATYAVLGAAVASYLVWQTSKKTGSTER